jgi:hypothetical protein
MTFSNLMIFLILALVILVIVRSLGVMSKIKTSRQMGVKLSNRNWYYKFLSKNFLKNLPS